MMKTRSMAVGILLLSAVALLASSPVTADDLPMANGEHWVAAPEKSKRAYLVGVANFLELEHAMQMQGENPPQVMKDKTLVQDFVKGLSNYSLEKVVMEVDAWYAANPDQLKRPILDLIYFKMVIPHL